MTNPPDLFTSPPLTVDLRDEMDGAFMEYAMSVIVSRALPDVRDGLKPVQRRIVHSMNQAKLAPTGRHRKSATVVGDVMARFHPHGDQAIYDALVRMGQPFSLSHPLVDPQGNFGTVDDPPAQMRYTECRMSRIAEHLVEGIEEQTVNMTENYDGEHTEPEVLPARFPNLLVNGSQGIAVGMATNIPPHNLGEIVDACLHMLNRPDCSPRELLKWVKGPDFPTGGRIVQNGNIEKALLTGRGSVTMRAVATTGEIRKRRRGIIITELPYQVSQDRVLARIADLVNQKTLTGIADLRNESSARDGTRLIVELKRSANPQVVLNQLFKRTQLETTFGVNMCALVDGVPRVMGVHTAVGHYLDHQIEVIRRRTRHRLKKAQARQHIVEGLLVAVDSIDRVIRIIRRSRTIASARQALIDRFGLSRVQTDAILEMPLRRLTALETERLAKELETLTAAIARLQQILGDPAEQRRIVARKLRQIRKEHATERRSLLVEDTGDLQTMDLIADERLVVTVSRGGYVKAVKASAYRTQGRGGKGVKAAGLVGDDAIAHLAHTTAHSYLLFFTNQGRAHRLRAHELPTQSRVGRGVLLHSVLPLEPDERIQAIVDTRGFDKMKHLVFFTRRGLVKKTLFKEYDSVVKTLLAVRLDPDDELVAVRTTTGSNDLLIFTEQGQGLRFDETQVRATGRNTRGVIGVRLTGTDRVVGACTDRDEHVLLVTSRGYAKRTKTRLFLHSGQGAKPKRGGRGKIAMKLTKPRGLLVGAKAAPADSQVMLVTDGGTAIRTPVNKITVQGRTATGIRIMRLDQHTRLAAFEVVP